MRVRAPGVPAAGPGGSAATPGPGSCREDAVTGAFPPTSVSSGTDGVDADGAAIAPGGSHRLRRSSARLVPAARRLRARLTVRSSPRYQIARARLDSSMAVAWRADGAV